MWGRTKGREAGRNYIMSGKWGTEVTGQKLLKYFGMMQTKYMATASHFNRIHGFTLQYMRQLSVFLFISQMSHFLCTLLRGPT